MTAPKHYPAGLGQTLGDALVTASPLLFSGDVWYVDSVIGDDSYEGLRPEAPLATLAQAHTNAASGDMVVLLATHSETISAPLTISKALCIVGAGSESAEPTAELLDGVTGASDTITISVAGVELRNIKFPTPASTRNDSGWGTVFFDANGAVRGCRFESGATHGTGFLRLYSGNDLYVRNCKFVSTATSIATRPDVALYGSADTPNLDLFRVEGCVFDGGAYGFRQHAFYLTGHVLRGEGNSFLRGADFLFEEVTGWLSGTTVSGAVRGAWS